MIDSQLVVVVSVSKCQEKRKRHRGSKPTCTPIKSTATWMIICHINKTLLCAATEIKTPGSCQSSMYAARPVLYHD